jgi:hypothetical protein
MASNAIQVQQNYPTAPRPKAAHPVNVTCTASQWGKGSESMQDCFLLPKSQTFGYIYIYTLFICENSRWFTLMTSKSRNHNIQKHIYRITCFAPDFANWNLLTSSDPNSGCRCALRIDSMASEVHVELLHVPFSNAERRLSRQLGWMFQK